MKDFIFITGASGVGKTTLRNGLLVHYKTTCVEQHMIPEFISRDGTEPMTGELEELTCWENQVGYDWLDIKTLNTTPLYPSKLRRQIMNLYEGKAYKVYLGNEEIGAPEVTD